MKFNRKRYPTIMSGIVIRYKIESNYLDGEINASRDGVSIQGSWPVFTDVDQVTEILNKAHSDYERLRRGDDCRLETDKKPEKVG